MAASSLAVDAARACETSGTVNRADSSDDGSSIVCRFPDIVRKIITVQALTSLQPSGYPSAKVDDVCVVTEVELPAGKFSGSILVTVDLYSLRTGLLHLDSECLGEPEFVFRSVQRANFELRCTPHLPLLHPEFLRSAADEKLRVKLVTLKQPAPAQPAAAALEKHIAAVSKALGELVRKGTVSDYESSSHMDDSQWIVSNLGELQRAMNRTDLPVFSGRVSALQMLREGYEEMGLPSSDDGDDDDARDDAADDDVDDFEGWDDIGYGAAAADVVEDDRRLALLARNNAEQQALRNMYACRTLIPVPDSEAVIAAAAVRVAELGRPQKAKKLAWTAMATAMGAGFLDGAAETIGDDGDGGKDEGEGDPAARLKPTAADSDSSLSIGTSASAPAASSVAASAPAGDALSVPPDAAASACGGCGASTAGVITLPLSAGKPPAADLQLSTESFCDLPQTAQDLLAVQALVSLQACPADATASGPCGTCWYACMIGPIPEAAQTEYRFQYVLVVVDAYSLHTKMRRLLGNDLESVAKPLIVQTLGAREIRCAPQMPFTHPDLQGELAQIGVRLSFTPPMFLTPSSAFTRGSYCEPAVPAVVAVPVAVHIAAVMKTLLTDYVPTATVKLHHQLEEIVSVSVFGSQPWYHGVVLGWLEDSMNTADLPAFGGSVFCAYRDGTSYYRGSSVRRVLQDADEPTGCIPGGRSPDEELEALRSLLSGGYDEEKARQRAEVVTEGQRNNRERQACRTAVAERVAAAAPTWTAIYAPAVPTTVRTASAASAIRLATAAADSAKIAGSANTAQRRRAAACASLAKSTVRGQQSAAGTPDPAAIAAAEEAAAALLAEEAREQEKRKAKGKKKIIIMATTKAATKVSAKSGAPAATVDTDADALAAVVLPDASATVPAPSAGASGEATAASANGAFTGSIDHDHDAPERQHHEHVSVKGRDTDSRAKDEKEEEEEEEYDVDALLRIAGRGAPRIKLPGKTTANGVKAEAESKRAAQAQQSIAAVSAVAAAAAAAAAPGSAARPCTSDTDTTAAESNVEAALLLEAAPALTAPATAIAASPAPCSAMFTKEANLKPRAAIASSAGTAAASSSSLRPATVALVVANRKPAFHESALVGAAAAATTAAPTSPIDATAPLSSPSPSPLPAAGAGRAKDASGHAYFAASAANAASVTSLPAASLTSADGACAAAAASGWTPTSKKKTSRTELIGGGASARAGLASAPHIGCGIGPLTIPATAASSADASAIAAAAAALAEISSSLSQSHAPVAKAHAPPAAAAASGSAAAAAGSGSSGGASRYGPRARPQPRASAPAAPSLVADSRSRVTDVAPADGAALRRISRRKDGRAAAAAAASGSSS